MADPFDAGYFAQTVDNIMGGRTGGFINQNKHNLGDWVGMGYNYYIV